MPGLQEVLKSGAHSLLKSWIHGFLISWPQEPLMSCFPEFMIPWVTDLLSPCFIGVCRGLYIEGAEVLGLLPPSLSDWQSFLFILTISRMPDFLFGIPK